MSKKKSMNILLLSKNRVVQELVKLAIKSYPNSNLEIIDQVKTPKFDRYDVILEEDNFLKEIENLGLEHLLVQRYILLGNLSLLEKDNPYDIVIKKPFLPKDIKRAIEDNTKEETLEDETINDFLQDEGIEFDENQMLDEADLKYIRSFLDGEIIEDESYDKKEELIATEDKKLDIDIDDFFELMKYLQNKKCKKVLQGATINISIKFPKDK